MHCRYVATSGFTPDVKVWEVKFSRGGEFEKVRGLATLSCCRIELTRWCGPSHSPHTAAASTASASGHKTLSLLQFGRDLYSSLPCIFYCSADSGRMATVSKDGTWKVFDTAVEWGKGQVEQLSS